MEGFVHLWRQSLDSEVFQSAELWRLWTWCLLKANHKDVFVPLKIGKGSTVIKVKKGQFIFGRNSCSGALNWSPSTARNRMKKLAEMGNIIVDSNNQYSIVTICNWSCFQGSTEKIGQPKDNQRTTKGQPKDTDNNDNKEEPIEEVKEVKEVKPMSDFDLFYEAYPKKKGKAQAEKAFKKLNGNCPHIKDLIAIIEMHKKSSEWINENGQFIPYPATWLNKGRWEDEITPETSTGTNYGQY